MSIKVPFHKPIFPEDLNAFLKESTDSGWVTTGPKVSEFEAKLCDYLDAEHVVAVNSCTAALHLALAARGIGAGDKFIVPTFTFVASVEVGEYLGAEPVLIDTDPLTFNLDLDLAEKCLKEDIEGKIKAIIPVHFAGLAVDMVRVHQLAEKYHLFVLEDAAHAIETVSTYGKVGHTPHAAAFSFYANKNITTGGEGGALATNDAELADKVRKLSLHGMSKDGWKRFETGGKWAYDVSELGYKYNMTDIAAAFGLEQLSHISDWHARRLEIVEKYCKKFSPIKGLILPTHLPGEVHAWHLFVIQMIPELWRIDRNTLIGKINEKGIGTSVHYIPIHMHSYYSKKYGYKPGDFPEAQKLSETVITLPLYPGMREEQVEAVLRTLSELWRTYKK
ncbi:MAG: DegT/DnrJ/EryC1/StrS aminotransferase family protein [Candidatus Marinimicrobia bacterium]|nr:DegT/DnrJ/EryC1/StrS aminotransferase family protein [Candidatus Neomarinimicrobiota bacterium]